MVKYTVKASERSNWAAMTELHYYSLNDTVLHEYPLNWTDSTGADSIAIQIIINNNIKPKKILETIFLSF